MHSVVVVEPEIPENTGFIARLAANFDFSLRLVNPSFNLEEARSTAKNAQGKLRNTEIYDSVEEAIRDLSYTVGTKPDRGQSVGEFSFRDDTSIMIGRESSGLTNEELSMCDAVVHIQTSGYSSVNQSHAAAILMHSLDSGSREETGLDPGLKQELSQHLPETVLEAVISSNPSESEAERMLGELSKDS